MPSFITSSNTSKPKAPSKKKLIIIGCVVVVLGISVGLWLLFTKVWSGDSSSSKKEQTVTVSNGPTTSSAVPITESNDYSKVGQQALKSVYDSKPANATADGEFKNLQVQAVSALVHEDWQSVLSFGNKALAMQGHDSDIGMLTYVSQAYMKLGKTAEYKATLTKLKAAYEAAGNTDSQQYTDTVKALNS